MNRYEYTYQVWNIGIIIALGMLAGCGVTAQEDSPSSAASTLRPLQTTDTPEEPIILPPVNPPEVTGDIAIAGSTVVFLLAEQLANMFRNAGYPDDIAFASIGTGGGFERFCSTVETDIVTASRPIRDAERIECQQNNRKPIAFRLGSDALAIAINPANDFVQDVTLEQLALIFSTANTWNEIDPAWPAEPIYRYVPGSDREAFNYFVDVMFDGNEVPLFSASNLQLSDYDEPLAQGVVSSPYAVGFFDYAFADQQRDRLRLVALNGTAPTSATIEAGTYPLTHPLYLYSDAGIMQDQPQVAAFLNYALTHVNDMIDDVGYVPASEAQITEAKVTWLVAMGLREPPPLQQFYLPLVSDE